MSLNIYKQLKNAAMIIVAILFSTSLLYAQPMTGTFTIDPAGAGATNFTTFKAAIDTLNNRGVGTGGVTFNVAAGATFAETGTLVLRATGTAANPIVFQKSGAGANPVINPALGSIATGTFYSSNGDVAWKIIGTDWLTIDGINVVEPAGRTSVALTEYGIALLRNSASDGNQNVTIKNCTVTLNRSTQYSTGIYVGAYGETFGSITPTFAGRNQNINIDNNNINNVYSAVYVAAAFASAPYDIYDHNVYVRNNTISNYGGSTVTAYGVYFLYTDSSRIANNTITAGTGQTTTFYGIFTSTGTGSSIDIDSNTVNMVFGGTTSLVNGINNAHGSSVAGINNVVNIRGNRVGLNSTTVTSSTQTFIANSGGAQTVNITGNRTLASSLGTTTVNYTGAISGITNSGFNSNAGSVLNITNNSITGITRLQTTTGSTGTFNGISVTSSCLTMNMSGNIVRNISTTNTTSTSNFINVTAGADNRNVFNNIIDSVFVGGGAMNGINISGGVNTNVYGNSVSGLYANKSAANTVIGINVTGGTLVNIYNNFVSNLRAPLATGSNAVIGVNITGGTTVNFSFNTVFLNATSSGTGFGTTALTFSSGAGNLSSRNNILYNASTPSGTGKSIAVRRTSVGTTNYNSNSNNNLLFAGTPGGANGIYFDGTNLDTTLARFKTRVASAESLSLTGTVDFVNTTTLPYDLHINTAIATLVEGAGVPVAGITTDYDGNTRAALPDIGADEGTFIAGADLQGPIISYTPFINTGVLTNRTISADIVDRSGINTTAGLEPRLYFRKRSSNPTDNTFNANNSSVAGWKYVAASTTTSPFSFTLDYSLLNSAVVAGDTIQYFVVAQDLNGSVNVNSNSVTYTVAPSSVNLSASNFPVTGAINQYRLLPQIATLVTVGTGGTYSSLTGTGGLFEAINGSVMVGNVEAQVLSHLDETGLVALNQFTEEGPGAGTFKLTIKPSAAIEDSIRGTFAGGMIKLLSADRVTFDGSFNGTGKYFVFINKNTTGTVSAIQLQDGGTNNGCTDITIKNSIFSGLTTATQSNANYGISAGSTPGVSGRNHHNLVIDSNDFNGLKFAIYAVGVTGGTEFTGLRIRANNIGSIDARIRDKGIVIGGAIGAKISRNTVYGIRTISSTVSTTMAGIQVLAGVTNSIIDRNNIYDLAFTGTGGWDARGITVASITNANDTIYGNTISYLRSDGFASITDATIGIAIEGGNNFHIYNNSINLFGFHTNPTFTSGPISAGIYVVATGVNLRNNLIQNNMKSPNATAAPASRAYGIWFSGGIGTGGQVTVLDNNNYAVDGSVNSKVVIINGTTAYNTLLDHQLANNRDKNSFAENPTFVDSLNLRINSGTVGTLLESHGQNIAGITRDIDNNFRPGPIPSTNGGALTFDIGADEFDGVYLADIFPPTVLIDSVRPLTNACLPLSHTVFARITDLSGIDTAEIRYSVNGIAQPSFLMTPVGGGRYTATIPAQAPGAVVIANIWAQDSLNNGTTVSIGTYTDAKFNFTLTSDEDTIATGSDVRLDALLPSQVKQIGTGTLRTTGVPNPYYTTFWGNKEQFLITAAELSALGYTAGNITSLALNVTTVTTTLPLTNFTIRMANTSLSALTTAFVTSGLQQVYTHPAYVVQPNATNLHVFQTPFAWDGVSNLLIETCFNNNNWNGSQSVEYTTTPFASCNYYYADAPDVCTQSTAQATSANRPNFILGQPVTATYVWSSSANGGLQSTNVRNPLATPTGGAGVYSYYLTANNGTCSWTDTIDVRVVAATTPVASFRTDTLSGVSGAKPTVFTVINTASNFPKSWKYTVTPANGVFVNGTNANSKAPQLIFNRAGTYTLKQVVTNAAGADSLTRANYINIVLDYCSPARTSTFVYNYISNVTLKNLNNSSANTAIPGYNKYVDSVGLPVPALIQGVQDTLFINQAQGSSWPTNNTATAWIDYNQDGDFTANERIGNIFNVAAANTVAGIAFKVPYTALTGTTRMRVRVNAFGTAGAPLDPCSSQFYGEAEDYTVSIGAAPNMALQAIKLEQDSNAVLAGTPNATVLRTKVIVTGFTNQLPVTSITVSSNGTTRLADIGSARVYFTGNVDTFNTSQLFGSATPAASMTIAGNAVLLGDTNYFWVVYDVDSFAVLGNNLDAEITSMTIGGVPSTPAVTAPAGKKQILLQAVPNILVATQPFNPIPVYPNSKDNPVVAAKVNMTVGVTSRLTSIRFSLTPNTKLSNISRARLIYTGNDSTFTSSNKLQFGTIPLSVGGVVEFTGNLKLQAGGNYFWLVADINNNAVVLDTLDGVFVGATIQNVVYNPTVGSPAGFRLVENFAYTCNSIPTLLDDEDIGRVQIGNFVNQSVSNLQFFGNPEAFNNYSNFASLPGMEVQVEVPTNYQVNVVNSDPTIFNATMNIFVDLNKNGQFDLPKERIVKRNVPSVPATLANRTPAGTFKLPIGTPSGKTFMRVMVIEVTTPGDTLIPCGGTYTWGEVEDYSLNILPAPPGDYYAPIVSNITLSPDSQCVATSHTITAKALDTTGVDSVWIVWTKNAVAQPRILMTKGSGDTTIYTGVIGPQGRANVKFDILAKDKSPRKNEVLAKGDTYQDEYFFVSAGDDKYVGVGQTASLSANTTLDRTFKITEFNFFNYTGGCGIANGSQCTWPSYLPTTLYDDNVEITNLSNAPANLSGYTLVTEGLATTFTFPAGTIVPAQGTVILHLNAGTTDPANLVFCINVGGVFPGSGTSMGFVLKDASGVIVDAIATNAYVFGSVNGVSSSDWSGAGIVSPGGQAGCTLQGADLNNATNWVLSSPATPVSIGFLNPSLPVIASSASITWTGGTLTAPVVGGSIVTPVHPTVGPYTYLASSSFAPCSYTDTIVVTAIAAPSVDLGPAAATICGTQAQVLNAAIPLPKSYRWFLDGNVIVGANGPTHSVSVGGMYKVIATDLAGQIATDSIMYTIAPPFSYTFGPDVDVCIGGARVLDAGAGYSSYLWSTGATTRTITVTDSGIYTIRVTNAGGCFSSDTFRVNRVAPSVVNLGADQDICRSNPVTLDAGNAGSTYLWSTGATTQTISVANAGTYSVIVNSVTGCTLFDTVVVTNKPAPSQNLGADFQLCPGNTAQLDAGNAGSTYLWSTGATTQTINITAPGAYIVQVTNAQGCATTDTVIVTPKVAPVVNLGLDRDICTSDTITLDAGNVGSTYLWSTGATTQTIRVSAAATYTVAVTNAGGCTTNDAVVVTNKPVPNSTYTQEVDSTNLKQVDFQAVVVAGNQYSWNFGDPTSGSNTSNLPNPTHLFSAGGATYTVTLTVTNVATGCKSVTTSQVTIVGVGNDFAKVVGLKAAPNPFVGNTKLSYELPADAAQVSLEVYDMVGRKVGVIVANEEQSAGVYSYDFNSGNNDNASGVYIVKLIVDGKVAITRVIDAGKQ